MTIFFIFACIVFAEIILTMAVWSIVARWWTYPAGRAIFVLLATLGSLLGLTLAVNIFGRFPGFMEIAITFYLFFIIGVAYVGYTIVSMNWPRAKHLWARTKEEYGRKRNGKHQP